MPGVPRLAPGDSIRCPRCRRDHVVVQLTPQATTADREFLYVRCRGDHYFVGLVKTAPAIPLRYPRDES